MASLDVSKSRSRGGISKDFTSGNILKQLIFLSIPFMLSNALQVLYSTIDMIIVGKYVGTFALSAVSQSSQIVNFAAMLCLAFSNAGQVLIAQALGAKKHKEMNDVVGTLTEYVLVLSLVISGIILVGKKLILDLINMPAEAYHMAEEYLAAADK